MVVPLLSYLYRIPNIKVAKPKKRITMEAVGSPVRFA